jgi:RNA polymerase sigma-70 factor (ECF subfamily)
MYEPEPTAPAASMTLALFTAMVDRHQHALCAFLHHLLSDAEQAADIMQDTFQEAWRAAQAKTAPFVTNCADDERQRWLFQVAYHRGISALRRRKLIRWESLDLLPRSQAGSAGASFEDQVVESEALRAALARLNAQDRACVLLRVVQGFSAAEVGQIVGASPEAVTKRLSRAKQRLRALYITYELAHEPPSQEERR